MWDMQELNGAINLPRLGVKPEPQPTCTLGGLTRARRGEIKDASSGPRRAGPGAGLGFLQPLLLPGKASPWLARPCVCPQPAWLRPPRRPLIQVLLSFRAGVTPLSRGRPVTGLLPSDVWPHALPGTRRLRELCRPRAGSLCPSSPAGKAPGPGREEHPGWPPAAGTGSGPKAHASVWSRSQQALEASPTPHSSALSFLHAEGQVRSTGGGSPV